MRPDFYSLNSSELVKAFNEMSADLAGISNDAGVPPVKRFATRDAGLRRCEQLYKTLCERKGEEYHIAEPPNDADIMDGTPLQAVRKKKRAKKAKKAPKAAKPVKQKKDSGMRSVKSDIVALCKVSGGTHRARALDYLATKLGRQCSVSSIMTAVYGSAEKSTAAFYTVMKALERDVVASKCKYILKRDKDEKGIVSYGLHSKNGN